MYKIVFLILFISFFGVINAKKIYTEVPALVHLPKSEQADTFGFNLVDQLPKLIYQEIKAGRIKLWNSPKKQVVLSFEALQKIESDNSVSFSKVENLFFNELWSTTLRKTNFAVIGFSFLAESPKGKISFGYIDFKEVLPILLNNFISTNVNGVQHLSYANAIYSRRYYFNLLQFGNNDFTSDMATSFKIKKDAFYSKKRVQGLVKLKNEKEVVYTFEKNPGDENDPSTLVFKNIENYLNDNKAQVLKIGGEKYFNSDVSTLSDFTVTRIEITETWIKKGASIRYLPLNIKIFVNNKPLNNMTISEFNQWQLLFKFKSIEDILIEKQFQLNLYKINSELIAFNESELYLRALNEFKWTQVSNFVKYTRE